MLISLVSPTKKCMLKLDDSTLTTHSERIITTMFRPTFIFTFRVGQVICKLTYTSQEVNNFANRPILVKRLKVHKQLQK